MIVGLVHTYYVVTRQTLEKTLVKKKSSTTTSKVVALIPN